MVLRGRLQNPATKMAVNVHSKVSFGTHQGQAVVRVGFSFYQFKNLETPKDGEWTRWVIDGVVLNFRSSFATESGILQGYDMIEGELASASQMHIFRFVDGVLKYQGQVPFRQST